MVTRTLAGVRLPELRQAPASRPPASAPEPVDNINLVNFGAQLRRHAKTSATWLRSTARAAYDTAVNLLEGVAPKLCYSVIPGALVGALVRPLFKTPAVEETTTQAPPPTRNKAEFVFGDEATLERALEMIKNARSSILFETFLLNGDHGKQIVDALIAKAQEGVPVRVILDPVMQAQEAATRQGDPRYHLSQRLRDAGIPVVGYDVELLDRSLRASDHTKLLICDNQAMIGGTNFDDMNNQDANVVLEGPAVTEFGTLFAEAWEASGGAPEDLPPLPDVPEPSDGVLTRVLSTDPVRHNIKEALLENLRTATESIDIAMFAFADPEIRDAVLEAHRSGVPVRVLLDPGETVFGMKNVGFPNQGTRAILEEAGIPLRYYNSRPGQQFHTKLAVFDGKKAVVGSTNFIPGAFENIKELSVELEGDVGACQAFFDQCWENSRLPEPLTGPGKAWGSAVDFLSRHLL